MVFGYALVHEKEQNFIRGRGKSDRGREVGLEGEGSGGRWGGKWGERGREVGIGYPPVHPLLYGPADQILVIIAKTLGQLRMGVQASVHAEIITKSSSMSKLCVYDQRAFAVRLCERYIGESSTFKKS